MKILIIDDEEMIREVYKGFVESLGHEAVLAGDGWEGFKEAGGTEYDVIISDMKMPGWDGSQSITGILNLKSSQRFIITTGYSDFDDLDELKSLPQVIDVLLKPVEFEVLKDAIDRAGASK